jgi:hypothetical protein
MPGATREIGRQQRAWHRGADIEIGSKSQRYGKRS